jgi:hypothetical protein
VVQARGLSLNGESRQRAARNHPLAAVSQPQKNIAGRREGV